MVIHDTRVFGVFSNQRLSRCQSDKIIKFKIIRYFKLAREHCKPLWKPDIAMF